MDPVLLVPADPVALLEVGVGFKLVDVGLVGGVREQLADLAGGEVGDADVPGEAGFADGFEGFPGLVEWSSSQSEWRGKERGERGSE